MTTMSDPQGWTVCVEHRGRHGVLGTSCIAVGREVPRRYRWHSTACTFCGQAIEIRRDRSHDTDEPLDAGTDHRHHHAPPITVQLDAEELAVALARASAALREARQTAPPREPPTPSAPGPPAPDRTDAGILGKYRS
jgi:hypothetical protein